MRVHSTLLRRAVPFAVLFLISLCAPARAGQGSRAAGISGQLYHSVSLDPVPSAIVVIEELGLEVKSDRNGRYRIDDFIFRNPVSDEEFDAKYGHEAQAGAGEGHGAPEFPVVAFVGADSLLQGVEVQTDAQLARHWFAEASFDYVRGELRAPGDPLPRIPPMRLRGGLRYQVSAFQAGGEVVGVATQDRVLGAETPTDGYTTLRLFAAYSFGSRDVVHTITARLENATNELYRNHLSYIKDVVPEMGRNFRLVYNVRF